jgi:hypothetical protein
MRFLTAGGLLLGLLFCCPPGAAEQTAIRLAECEGTSLSLWLCGGYWTLNGGEGKAVFPSGVVAELTIERFDSEQVIIRRKDVSDATRGLSAVYTGKLHERRITGDATYLWPGHWDTPVKGTWAATIDEMDKPSSSTTADANASASPAGGHVQGPLPNVNGVWVATSLTGSGARIFTVDFAVLQDGADVIVVQVQPGHPRFVTFRGHFDSSTTIAGHPCELSPSRDDPYCLPDAVVATLIDASHLKDNQGNELKKVAGQRDPRYALGLPMVPTKNAKRYLPEKPFDLTGTWQHETQRGPIGRIQIVQKDGLVDFVGPFGGYPDFTGWYLQNPIMQGTELSRASKDNNMQWTPIVVYIDNPDQIRIKSEVPAPLPLYRLTAPDVHDLPCDAENTFHVTRYYAWVRGEVAIGAKDASTAKCWATLSANQGFPAGQSLLAVLLLQGTAPDYQKVFDLVSKSAQAGEVTGQLVLASLYRDGNGIPKDASKAAFWVAQAKRSSEIAAWQRINTTTQDVFGMSAGQLAMKVIDIGQAIFDPKVDPKASEEARRLSKGIACSANPDSVGCK